MRCHPRCLRKGQSAPMQRSALLRTIATSTQPCTPPGMVASIYCTCIMQQDSPRALACINGVCVCQDFIGHPWRCPPSYSSSGLRPGRFCRPGGSGPPHATLRDVLHILRIANGDTMPASRLSASYCRTSHVGIRRGANDFFGRRIFHGCGTCRVGSGRTPGRPGVR